ncbi:hypothetical protein OG2516_15809 [Oceanicola granulosus HTCC2516]|uniref:Uncharacterized protein n=1 Tax=Oceanicola granulosus (strain ATCC BAA-861 / DSM 15982 / KCTC 12143 / HTCC2516) TaxID=314256 RepID=Q2CBV2_OCEGH|nr:hypothetical protein OG2516_15809 [Oceanicola granulosus HTCC2516]
MTNVEIEDVLASIRRLVAGEEAAERSTPRRAAESGAQGAARPAPPAARPAGKLVLTEAHRVPVDAPARPAPPAPSAAKAPSGTSRRLADVMAAADGAAPAPPERAQSETSPGNRAEAPGFPPDETLHAARARRLAEEATEAEAPSDDWPAAPVVDTSAFAALLGAQRQRDESRAAWAPTEAGEEPAAGAFETAPEDEAVEDDDFRANGFEDEAVETEEVAEADPWEDVAEPAPQVSARQRIESTIAELEAAVTFSGDEFEPDGGEQDSTPPTFTRRPSRLHLVVTGSEEAELVEDTPAEGAAPEPAFRHAPEPQPAAERSAPAEPRPRPIDLSRYATDAPAESPDHASDEAVHEPAPTPGQNAAAHPALDEDDELAAYLDNESFLDEEALREMVSSIVREELQGVLGERITRNVRKLVRREIHRILNSQEFD